MGERLQQAVTEWTTLLGEERVAGIDTDAYMHSTTGAHRRVPYVLRPERAEQIPELVRGAQRWRIPLYPISRGQNWGYGSANPVVDDCVIVDLSDLDRISHFDPNLGVVTVEPGVTQETLRQFLDEQDGDFLVPVTGGGPNCSILGNALERGYGITPFADHFAAVTAIEVVLPDGTLYRTPLSELGGAEVDRLYKWGVGPYIDGLFSQGNFGIVVRMTIALAPAPESLTAFFFGVRHDRDLEAIVPAVRRVLREMGAMVPAINLLNRQRMLSMMAPFPEAEAQDGVIPSNVVHRLAREHGVQAWNGVGALYTRKDMARPARRALRRLLGPVCDRLIFVDEPRLRWARRVAAWLPRGPAARIRSMGDTLQSSLDIMNGRPSEVALPLAYWRSGVRPAAGQAMNPAQDGCGLIWYAPLVPMRGEAVRRHVRNVERICPEYGISPLVTLTTASPRCFDSTVPLLFDRADPEAVQRANACYDALLAAGRADGFMPYRLNVDAMGLLAGEESVFAGLVARLKESLDPNHIIAPGRYVPAPDTSSHSPERIRGTDTPD